MAGCVKASSRGRSLTTIHEDFLFFCTHRTMTMQNYYPWARCATVYGVKSNPQHERA